ncbi:MAG TPA: sigma-54 dependent transcriptional regulator [Vicinamibacteria bacterium]|nr:sigma-54 dependent transcriptional regulator [Vicinamibacteria bacterium]
MVGGRSILLVEDHAESRASLTYVLEKRGEVVHQAGNGRAALAVARRETLHALILDLKLPDMDGLSVLDAVLAESPGLPVVVVTGFGTIDAAVDAMRRGASDFLTKPIQVDNLLAALDRSIERAGEDGTVSTPPSVASAEMARLGIIGESRAMQALFDTLKRMAPHDSTVLILGESGTGKELIARALHTLGQHAAGPFVPINCATLSDPILESELFGHEKGAFTSADQAKPGVMETADGGTLFLDEVSEMGLSCQAKLLRAIERREFRRVGGTRKINVNLRVVAASNVSLEDAVTARRFRPDLYYRLKVMSLRVPPLRERKEAIPVLARRLLDQIARNAHVPPKRLTADATAQLGRYDWPGNVRELRNVMESVALIGRRSSIDVGDLPMNVRGIEAGLIQVAVGSRLDEVERQVIRRTLDSYPTVKESARVLGIGLRTLHTKIRRYGLRGRRP